MPVFGKKGSSVKEPAQASNNQVCVPKQIARALAKRLRHAPRNRSMPWRHANKVLNARH